MTEDIIDGYRIDTDTGEILGLAEHDPAFHVTDRTSAEWVLEKLGRAAADLAALEVRRAAILANLDAQASQFNRRTDWLTARFGAELQDYATLMLIGAKRKSLQLDFGKLGFRKTNGSVKVFHAPSAIAWLQTHCPRALQPQEPKILVSLIPDELRPELPTHAFDYTPPENKFYVA